MGSSNPKTAADESFEAYLVDHEIAYEYEPPWEERLAVSTEVNPDFLIDPAGARVVAEVKQFETTHITDRLTRSGGVATLSDREVYGHLRATMINAAREQLLPFAEVGVPLVVVLANPLGGDVSMDFHHVFHAILGNPKFTISVGPNAPPDDPGQYVAEDYGAFVSVTEDGLVNYHPHVSAVVVVHERANKQDWIEATLASERDPEGLEDAGEAMVRYMKLTRRLEEAGEAPEGSYRWVEVYDLSDNPTPPGFQGVPLPRAVFSGPRDRWYGFADEAFQEID